MQNTFPGRKRIAPMERRGIIESYLRSELPQKEFAAEAGIAVSTLQYWLRKSPRKLEPAEPVFVEVPLPPATPSSRPGYRLHFSKGHLLEIPTGFPPEEVQQLWQILQTP
jgi:transposase-like protein